MNNKKSLIVMITGVIALIAITSATTYAYLSANATQKDENTFTTACYNITFTDTNRINILSYPISNENAFKKINPYHFSLKNDCETTTEYQIILNIINTTDSKILPYINYSFDGVTVNKLSSLTPATLPPGVAPSNTTTSYIINTGYIEGINATKNFNLYMWIDESAGNDIMGSKFEAEVAVYNVAR